MSKITVDMIQTMRKQLDEYRLGVRAAAGAMSKHVAGAAILARFCLPLSKADFLDLCGAAWDAASVKADEFQKEWRKRGNNDGT